MKYATCAGAFMVAALFVCATPVAPGQDLPPTEDPSSAQQGSPAVPVPQTSTLDDTLVAGEAGAEEPARKLVKWNEFEGKYFSIRVGGGFLYEFAAFAQDDDSKEQFVLEPQTKFRDGRVLLRGKLKFIKRPVTWSMGIMYDAPNDQWVARQTGLMIDVPEISGQIFIGRTKEGFSLNKVMVGYAGWTAERATINDATIPILADGIKWLRLFSQAAFPLEPRVLRGLDVSIARVLYISSPGCGTIRMGSDDLRRNRLPCGVQRPIWRTERRKIKAPFASRGVSGPILRRYGTVSRQRHEDAGA